MLVLFVLVMIASCKLAAADAARSVITHARCPSTARYSVINDAFAVIHRSARVPLLLHVQPAIHRPVVIKDLVHHAHWPDPRCTDICPSGHLLPHLGQMPLHRVRG